MPKLRPIDGQTLHQHRYIGKLFIADSGGRFDLSNPFPWIAFLAKQRVFHFTGRRRWWRERGRDCQQDADDPTSSSSATKRREISLLPIQRIRALPARVTSRRGLQLPFFELLRKRGREREREVSSLFRGRVPSFPIPRVPLSPLLLSCWRGVRKHDRGGRGFFLSVSRPREESRDFKHGYTRRYSRFVSIFYFLFPD